MKANTSKADAFIRELCKGRTEEQIQEALEALYRYFALVARICERLEREEQEQIDSPPVL